MKGVNGTTKHEMHNSVNQDVNEEVSKLASGAKAGNEIRERNSLRVKTNKIVFGENITRLQQTYGGFPVFGGDVVHVDIETGGVQKTLESGSYYRGLEDQLGDIDEQQLNSSTARTAVMNRIGKKDSDKDFSIHVTPAIHVDDNTMEAQVAFHVDVDLTASGTPSKPQMIVGSDGQILVEYDNIQTSPMLLGEGPGGNQGIGRHEYGANKANDRLKVTKVGDTCLLKTDDVITVHLNFSSYYESNKPYAFKCPKQTEDARNGGYSPLNDAHYYGHVVVDMFQTWYRKDPLDKKPIFLKTHYKRNYQNAIWTGEEAVFGDGGEMFYPLTVLDVIAHEIGHGITSQSSDLLYYGQSGALNEAFSDMTGAAAKFFLTGKVHHTMMKDAGKDDYNWKYVRCMDKPRCDGNSIEHVKDYTFYLDVHYSSGVFNKVFAILSEKLKYKAWDAYDIFYVANTQKWISTTGFKDAAETALEAAEELKAGLHWTHHNYGHIDIDVVKEAFKVSGSRSRTVFWVRLLPVLELRISVGQFKLLFTYS